MKSAQKSAFFVFSRLGLAYFARVNVMFETDQPLVRTPTDSIVNVFKNRGFNVTSSFDTQQEDGKSFNSVEDFYHFVKSKLKENAIIIVENIEWGGHWRVIIGYDDMGKPDNTSTHVLIFADPYDTTDHNQNGYTIRSVERFFGSWFDHDVMPANQKIQQYVCVSK